MGVEGVGLDVDVACEVGKDFMLEFEHLFPISYPFHLHLSSIPFPAKKKESEETYRNLPSQLPPPNPRVLPPKFPTQRHRVLDELCVNGFDEFVVCYGLFLVGFWLFPVSFTLTPPIGGGNTHLIRCAIHERTEGFRNYIFVSKAQRNQREE